MYRVSVGLVWVVLLRRLPVERNPTPMQATDVFSSLHSLVIEATLFVVFVLTCCKLIVHEWRSLRRLTRRPKNRKAQQP